MGSHKRGRRDLATKQQDDKHNFFFELYVLSLQCFKGILPSLNSHHPSKYVNDGTSIRVTDIFSLLDLSLRPDVILFCVISLLLKYVRQKFCKLTALVSKCPTVSEYQHFNFQKPTAVCAA